MTGMTLYLDILQDQDDLPKTDDILPGADTAVIMLFIISSVNHHAHRKVKISVESSQVLEKQ